MIQQTVWYRALMRFRSSAGIGLLMLTSLAAGCVTRPAELERIIDVHTHPEFSPKASMAEFDAQRAKAGVTMAVGILHSDEGKLPEPRASRAIFCAGVDASPNLTTLEEGLQNGTYRCVKIYLGYVHKYASDDVYQPVYALAEKYDVPVIFHTGDTSSVSAKLKFSDPLTIDEVAVDHPKVRFVIAHCGNPWIESAAEVAYKNPNVYLDGSAFLIGDMTKLSRDQVQRYVIEPLNWIFGYVEDPNKLMFGTDWPLVNIPSYVDAFKKAIPRKYWKKVFHDNAVKVFKIDERE
ncbi:MAG: amidohydrolase family protein [Thermoanaerobaculia bacterium]